MNEQLTVGSLFAGIGGFDLGFERAGMRTVWFCEQDPFCQRVLARHWPGVPVFDDVRALVADTDQGRSEPRSIHGGSTGEVGIRAPSGPSRGRDERPVPMPVPPVDVLCGGFPCQDISVAGRGAGLDGDRSGLWSEYARLIRELRPRYVVVENVAALLARGMGRVLGNLAACGYDAEWDCIPASAVGAPHRRDRVWLVAYPNGSGLEGPGRAGLREEVWAEFAGGREHGALQPPEVVVGDTDAVGRDGRPGQQRPAGRGEPTDAGWWAVEPDVGRVAHGIPAGLESGGGAHARCLAEARAEGASDHDLLRAVRQHMALAEASRRPAACGVCGDPLPDLPHRGGLRGGHQEAPRAEDLRDLRGDLHGVQPLAREVLLAGVPVRAWTTEREETVGHWDREPDVGRVAHGVPQRVDRLRALGNSLVPQIAELIGRRIVEWEHAAMREAA